MSSFEENLQNIANLQDGWNGGEGIAIPTAVIDAARQLVTAVCRNVGEHPSIEAESDGNIDIFWFDHAISCYLGRNLELVVLSGLDFSFARESFDLSRPEQLAAAVNYLRELCGPIIQK